MKVNKNSYVFKIFKAYERFFTDQEKADVMGEEILFLTREESERRLFVGKKSITNFKYQNTYLIT